MPPAAACSPYRRSPYLAHRRRGKRDRRAVAGNRLRIVLRQRGDAARAEPHAVVRDASRQDDDQVAADALDLLLDPLGGAGADRSEDHTSELQSLRHLVCPRQQPALPIDALPISRTDGAARATAGRSRAIAFASSSVSVATPPEPSRTPLFVMLPGRTMIRLLPMLWICCWIRSVAPEPTDRKTTRLNSSHLGISYAPGSSLLSLSTLSLSRAPTARHARPPGGRAQSPSHRPPSAWRRRPSRAALRCS